MPLLRLWLLQLFCHEESMSLDDLSQNYKRMPEPDREQDPLSDIVEAFISEGWLKEDEENFLATESLQLLKEKVYEACALHRDEWRKKLLEHVCNYVKVPESHPIRNVLMNIDRRFFMPEGSEWRADYDKPVMIKPGMTESAIHAVLYSILPMNPMPGDHVMVCGAKGGMLGGMLSGLVGKKGKVTMLDWDEDIIEHIEKAYGRSNTLPRKPELVLKEDVTEGHPIGSPWDIIILNGTVPKIPYDLIHQLNDEKGRILFHLADSVKSSQCFVIHKNKSIIREEKMSRFRYTNIPGKYGFDDIAQLQSHYERSKENINNQLLTRITHSVHYPVSRSFHIAFNARHPHERHGRILKLAECLLKYLTILTLSEIHAQGTDSPRFSESLMKLTGKPANGIWLSTLRDALPLGAGLPVCDMISEDWDKFLKHSDVITAQEMLIRETERRVSEKLDHVRFKDFMDQVIRYRNKVGEGHGNVTSQSQADALSNALIRAFGRILPELSIFKTTQLLYVHSVERKGNSNHLVASQLSNLNFTNERYPVDDASVTAWYLLSSQTVLCSSKREKVLLNLHPWMIWTDSGNTREFDLFMFNSSDAGNYQYITYHNRAEYPDPNLRDDFEKLLSKYPVKQPQAEVTDPTKEIFNNVMKTLLDVFLQDMRISKQEMDALVDNSIKLGVATTREDAEVLIRNMIDRDHPGVYYGDE